MVQCDANGTGGVALSADKVQPTLMGPSTLAGRSLWAWFKELRETHPDDELLWTAGRGWLTAAAVNREIEAVSSVLGAVDLGSGTITGIAAQSGLAVLVAVLAVLAKGYVALVYNGRNWPVSPTMTVQASERAGTLQWEVARDLAAHEAAPISDGDIWLSSSGTSGTPKYVRLSSDRVMANALASSVSLLLGPDDVTVVTLPLHHGFSFVAQVLGTLVAGGRVALHGWPPREELTRDLGPQGSTWFATPSMVRLLSARRDMEHEWMRKLRLTVVGGGMFDGFHALWLRGRAPGASLAVTYGLSEAGPG